MSENEKPHPEQHAAANSAGAGTTPSGRKRGLLIGAAAAVALIAVGGGAFAIGANMGGDDDDRPAAVDDSGSNQDDSTSGNGDDSNGADDDGAAGDGTQDDGADDADGTDDNGGSHAGMPASDAAAMRAAAEEAIAETDAKGVTSIDVERIGYEIEVQLADGSEPDVRVAEDGTVTVEKDRQDDDDRPEPLLDLDKLADIQKAALSAVSKQGGADGVVDSVSTSDDGRVAYGISVRLPDGRDADVELAADLTVVTVDLDD